MASAYNKETKPNQTIDLIKEVKSKWAFFLNSKHVQEK